MSRQLKDRHRLVGAEWCPFAIEAKNGILFTVAKNIKWSWMGFRQEKRLTFVFCWWLRRYFVCPQPQQLFSAQTHCFLGAFQFGTDVLLAKNRQLRCQRPRQRSIFYPNYYCCLNYHSFWSNFDHSKDFCRAISLVTSIARQKQRAVKFNPMLSTRINKKHAWWRRCTAWRSPYELKGWLALVIAWWRHSVVDEKLFGFEILAKKFANWIWKICRQINRMGFDGDWHPAMHDIVIHIFPDFVF